MKSLMKFLGLLFLASMLFICSSSYYLDEPVGFVESSTLVGKLIKIEKSGVIYDTYEGVLESTDAAGNTEAHIFSVAQADVGADMVKHKGYQVTLTCETYRIVPVRIGKTNRLVTSYEK